MTVRCYPVSGKPKSLMICHAFAEGAPPRAECSVFYGVNESNHAEWLKAQKRGDWYYIDNSYFDKVRGKQYRVTKNAVQCKPIGQASDGKRFAKLGIELKPMNLRSSDLWVFIEQSPSFMQYVAHDPHWLERMVGSRPAGARIDVRRWDSNKLKQQETLPQVIEDAWTVVAHSSAASVTALLLGIPTIVSEMSALYGIRISTHPDHDQRLHCMNVLADNQWTLDEIREGKAWRHLAKS